MEWQPYAAGQRTGDAATAMGIDRMGPWQGGVRSSVAVLSAVSNVELEWTTVCALLRGVGPGIGGVVRCFAVKNRNAERTAERGS